jgi:hypothetical protein
MTRRRVTFGSVGHGGIRPFHVVVLSNSYEQHTPFVQSQRPRDLIAVRDLGNAERDISGPFSVAGWARHRVGVMQPTACWLWPSPMPANGVSPTRTPRVRSAGCRHEPQKPQVGARMISVGSGVTPTLLCQTRLPSTAGGAPSAPRWRNSERCSARHRLLPNGSGSVFTRD